MKSTIEPIKADNQAMNAEWPTARLQMEDQPRPPGYRKRSVDNRHATFHAVFDRNSQTHRGRVECLHEYRLAISDSLRANRTGRHPAAQVLDFLFMLKQVPKGVLGVDLKGFAGTLSEAEARSMIEAIEAGCEQVDPDGW